MLSPHTPVAEILDCSPVAATMLIDLHVVCVGCSMNRFCTLDEVYRNYDIDLSYLAELVQERIGINLP